MSQIEKCFFDLMENMNLTLVYCANLLIFDTHTTFFSLLGGFLFSITFVVLSFPQITFKNSPGLHLSLNLQ